jgi:4-hydroxy-tetrahydrodipicolinate synthase
VEVAAGAVPVYAGASSNSVVTAKPCITRLADAGVSAVVLTLPFYGWYDDQSCAVDFFCEIADFSPIPVIVYNLPRVAGTSLSLESILAIADHPNIIALKDTRPQFEEMLAVASCEDRRGKISYLVGNTVLAGSLLRAGADGLVSTMGNVYPHLIQCLWQSHNRQHRAMVETCTKLIAEFNPIFGMPTTPASTKWALELAGIGKARTVRPWPMPNAEQREKIRAIMNSMDRQLSALGIARIASHACGLC